MTYRPIDRDARIARMRENGLPLAPNSFAPYEAWIAAAFAHLAGAIDTAIDELQRDRDFLDLPHSLPSPDGATRDECIREAVRRFVAATNDAQEG